MIVFDRRRAASLDRTPSWKYQIRSALDYGHVPSAVIGRSPSWLGRSPERLRASPGHAIHGPLRQTHPDLQRSANQRPVDTASFFRNDSRPERDLAHRDILDRYCQYIQGFEMLPLPVLVLIGELLAARLMLPAG
jgi:hypothetical protein